MVNWNNVGFNDCIYCGEQDWYLFHEEDNSNTYGFFECLECGSLGTVIIEKKNTEFLGGMSRKI